MTARDPIFERLAIAQATILDPNGLSDGVIDRALSTIAMYRIDQADLYFQTTKQEAWVLEDGTVKTGSFSIRQGVGVRAIAGGRTAFAYSDDLSDASLQDAARAVRTIGSAGQSKRVRVSKRSHLVTRQLYDPADPINAGDAAHKIALLQKIEHAAKARDPRITQVTASVGLNYEVVYIAQAGGERTADVRPLVKIVIDVLAEQNGRREIGTGGGGGRYGLAAVSDALIQRYVDQAVDGALVNLESRPAPSGEMTVVLGSGGPGVLLHEAVGHGLEADFNRKGESVYSGHIGQRVAAKGVTIVDDGTLPTCRGSLNVDDEGSVTQRTVLIEDGILRGYMQDALNARLMGMHCTGNCRRESYAHLPMPRMTNTSMMAGTLSREEIVGSIKRGLYATAFDNGEVDITNGNFMFLAREAYWVENGRIKYPVKDAAIVGNGPTAMTRITMIGNDPALDLGVSVCGKEGQRVPVSVGQPTLRIEGLTVGGTD